MKTVEARETRFARSGRSLPGMWLAMLVFALASSGCVGYLMGWSDAEVERLRRIVAELEAKNAELVEENLRLRSAAGRLPASDRPAAPGGEREGSEGGSTCPN